LTESLEEILTFPQNGSNTPAYVKKGFKDYSMEAGLLFYQGRIVVPDNEELRQDLITTFHDSPMAGHPGQQRTLELVSRRYYWPGMRAKIFQYVETCETCQRIKRTKISLIPIQPLEIPTRPWQHISYNMIVGLPMDGGKDAILVIVDSFSKYSIMVPCLSKVTAKDIADLFLEHVWKRHGFPEKTISDRGPVFNHKYIKALYEQLGIKAHFSSAYHPQSDGQTERMNPAIEQSLRAYTGMYQKDWVKWLPMAEFSYNNAIHSATGTSPFRCLYGRDPVMTPSKVTTEVPEANSMADTLQRIWDETSAALKLVKEWMAGREPGEVPETFDIGEKVWLDSRNLRLKTNSPKLTDWRIGPFKVVEKLLDRAYRLQLPEILKIHNVFYVRILSKVKEDKARPIIMEPGPLEIEGEEEYEVEEIVDSKRCPDGWYYRVKWKGYGPKSNTWELKANLEHAEKILRNYHQRLLKKARDAAKSLKGGAVS
jgi:hypothetical protein